MASVAETPSPPPPTAGAASGASDWWALIRPSQWVKNGFVLAPLLFSGKAGDLALSLRVLAGAAVFCLLSSGVYAVNDVFDADADRRHPVKRLRPVASGRITPLRALGAGITLLVVALGAAAALHAPLGLVAGAYVLLNLLYSRWLKHVVLVDVFLIATFFILRLEAGAVLIDVVPTVWLLLCGGLLALYLGFAKRRHELMLLKGASGDHRTVLRDYDATLLDQVSVVLLSVTLVSYLMYTLTSETALLVGSDRLSYSVVFVLYGVFRFLYLVHRREAGNPTEAFWTDGPLAVTVILWLAYCGWVIYSA